MCRIFGVVGFCFTAELQVAEGNVSTSRENRVSALRCVPASIAGKNLPVWGREILFSKIYPPPPQIHIFFAFSSPHTHQATRSTKVCGAPARAMVCDLGHH